MRKKSLILCGFAVIMGVFGGFLRWLQNINAFEADTGLAIPHSPWSYAVMLFAVLFAILLLVWLREYRHLKFASGYPEVYAKTIPFVSVAAVIIGALVGVGGLLTLYRAVTTSKSAFDLILGLFSILCAFGLASLIMSVDKPKKEKKSGVFGAVTTVFFLCFWLIAAYKYSASDPVIWHFAPRLLTICAMILAFYYIAGFVFNKPRPLASLYFGLLGVFMGISVLVDTYPVGEQLITFGFAASIVILSFSQLNSAENIS